MGYRLLLATLTWLEYKPYVRRDQVDQLGAEPNHRPSFTASSQTGRYQKGLCIQKAEGREEALLERMATCGLGGAAKIKI